jgi:hypothetical protein
LSSQTKSGICVFTETWKPGFLAPLGMTEALCLLSIPGENRLIEVKS